MTLEGTSTGSEENSSRYLAFRGCYCTPGCGKAGEYFLRFRDLGLVANAARCLREACREDL